MTAGPRIATGLALIAAAGVSTACRGRQADGPLRASGYVEATEVRVAPEVGGRVLEIKVDEGDRVDTGALLARLDTSDTGIAIRRVEAERAQAASAVATAAGRGAAGGDPPGTCPGRGGAGRRGRRPVRVARRLRRCRAVRGAARVEGRLPQAARRCRDPAGRRGSPRRGSQGAGTRSERSRGAAESRCAPGRARCAHRPASMPSTRSWRPCGRTSPTRAWLRRSAGS